MSKSRIIFSTRAYRYLANELASLGNFEIGRVIQYDFPDGESYHRLDTHIEDSDVILVGGTIDDHNTMELYDLAQGISHACASTLSIVIPYFGYSTMERAVKPGEIVKAKNRALLFSSIPSCNDANRIYLLDLHAEGIPYYFDRDIRTTHLYAKKIMTEVAREWGGDHFVLAATDAGRAKWVESLANDIGVGSAFVYKQRLSGSETRITGINAPVNGHKVLIYDDMIRTGSSLMKAAAAYQEAGASDIIALCTHGLFTNNALDVMREQGIISRVICTNSHPAANNYASDYLVVKSVAKLIFEAFTD